MLPGGEKHVNNAADKHWTDKNTKYVERFPF
jgi:hypothetical protein